MSATLYRVPLLAALLAAFAAPAHAGAPTLPSWFPLSGATINPDQLQPEDYGTDEFKVAKDTIHVSGHHWSTALFGGKNGEWNGQAVWKALRPALEKQGFAVVFLDNSNGVDATFRKGTGDHATYVEVFLTQDDGFSNWVHIIEVAAQTRTLKLVPPAAKPETLADDHDFPYATALAGAKLLGSKHEPTPLDVAIAQDKEPHLVGTGMINKLYEGPDGLSPEDFTSTYDAAFRAAGWTIADKAPGSVLAHFAKSGRDVWARLHLEGGGRWDIDVADAGTGVRAALDKGCKVALYGLRFDFNKATLRPDSDPVLQQVLAILKSDGKTTFELRGHTDNVGDKAYNQTLSGDRADAVKKWLVGHGVAAERLTTKGFGDTAPLVPNDSDLARAKNRRVELAKSRCE